MWRWMLPGGIVLGAALGGIIAASPHPARTAGDVTAIVVVVVAFGIPWLGMSSENRARRQWASQRDEAARALAPADRGSTAESAAGPGPSAASGPWLGSVIQGYDKMTALLGGPPLAWSTNHAPHGPAPATRRHRERGGFGAAMAVLLGGIACLPPASPGAASRETTAPTAAPAPTTLNYAATTLGWSITPTIVAQEIGF